MPIPFLEALRGRLAPVFNGTVPLEREKEEKGHKRGLAGERGRRRKTAQTHNKRHTNSAHLLRSRCGAEAEEVQIMKKKKKEKKSLDADDDVGELIVLSGSGGGLRVTTRQPGVLRRHRRATLPIKRAAQLEARRD